MVTLTHKKVVNIYIVYEINLWPFNVSEDLALENYLFGAVKLTKNITDFGKYKYFRYGIGYDARRGFTLSDGRGFGKYVIIFSADMSSSVHVDNKNKIS